MSCLFNWKLSRVRTVHTFVQHPRAINKDSYFWLNYNCDGNCYVAIQLSHDSVGMRLHMLKVQSSTLPHFRCQLPGKFPCHMFLTIWVQIQRVATTFLYLIIFFSFSMDHRIKNNLILTIALWLLRTQTKTSQMKSYISSGLGGPNSKLSRETGVLCSQLPVLQLGHAPASSQLVTGVQPLTAWLGLLSILPHERDQAGSNL